MEGNVGPDRGRKEEWREKKEQKEGEKRKMGGGRRG